MACMDDAGPTPEQIDDAMRAVANVVRAKYDVVGVYFFGSRARGDYRPDSDVDVAFVLRNFEGDAYSFVKATSDVVNDFAFNSDIFVQAVPVRLEHWENPMDAYNPFFIEAIQQEGIPLW
jgi:uncharacterized protein